MCNKSTKVARLRDRERNSYTYVGHFPACIKYMHFHSFSQSVQLQVCVKSRKICILHAFQVQIFTCLLLTHSYFLNQQSRHALDPSGCLLGQFNNMQIQGNDVSRLFVQVEKATQVMFHIRIIGSLIDTFKVESTKIEASLRFGKRRKCMLQ